VAVYFNLFLIRQLFQKGRFLSYLLAVVFLMVTATALYFFIFESLVPAWLTGYYFIAYYSAWQIVQFVSSYVVFSLLLHLSVGWFILKDKELQLEKENHQVQLKNLKAQINPHFLFNSLNNIYALAGADPQVRTYLSRLSDSLRYMIYDTEADLVPMKNEVEYLDNYFEIEKLRLAETTEVYFRKGGKFDQHVIAPLLLLPLLENCFVHCDRQSPVIHLELRISDDQLHFKSFNNKPRLPLGERGGVGLDNVRKRLNLIYPDRHKMEVREDQGSYHISLSINLAKV
jgi:two-component system, LytTR family, sensor kinase